MTKDQRCAGGGVADLRAWAVCGALVVLVLSAAACAATGPPPNTNVSLPAEPSSVTATEVVSWGEAASRIGQAVIVEGPVVSATRVGGSGPAAATLLNIGLDAPSTARFVALIPDSSRTKFPQPLKDTYVGMLVRVSGTIADDGGVATIRVTRPRQIRIVE